MRTDRWERIRAVFLGALDLDEADRPAWVEASCGSDALLAAEVQLMLGAEKRASGFLEPPTLVGDPNSQLDATALARGTKVDDLEIIGVLGRGAQGIVYLARQTPLDRLVAVKLLRGDISALDCHQEGFLAEASRMANLKHQGIVPVYSTGRYRTVPYYVMEYVPGRSLREFLDEVRELARSQGGAEAVGASWRHRLQRPNESYVGFAARIVSEVADALHAAHERDLIHRDIKPGNILLDESGSSHVVDFGVSKVMTQDSLSEVVGTFAYMSPEQARVNSRAVDRRTDVYSLGVVLYELLTLVQPIRGDSPAELLQALKVKRPVPVTRSNPKVPRDLGTICHRAMAWESSDRYPTCEALAVDLGRFLAHGVPLARPFGLVHSARTFLRHHRAATVMAGFLALLVAGVFWWNSLAESRRTDEQIVRLEEDYFHALPEPGPGLVMEFLDIFDRLRKVSEIRARGLSDRQARLLRRLEDTALGRSKELQGIADRSQEERRVGSLSAGINSAPQMLLSMSEQLPEGPPRQTFRDAMGCLVPRVTLRSEPTNAKVYVILLDDLSELSTKRVPQYIGRTELLDYRLGPGYYLFQVVADDGRYGEITFPVTENGRFNLPKLRLKSLDEVRANMVRIPAGPYEPVLVQKASTEGPPRVRHALELPEFWVDRTEVTNGEYGRFCQETGHRTPRCWPVPDVWQREWDRLPVTWVDFYDAQAYAAWAGKRLLSIWEWERMARESDDPRRPPEERVSGEPLAVASETPQLDEEEWVAYSKGVAAVATSRDVTPEGVFDTRGNLREWTRSMPYGKVFENQWQLMNSQRFQKGFSWRARPNQRLLTREVASQARDVGAGIRCGKSVVRH